MVKAYDSDAVQRMLAKVFIILGIVFDATAIVLFFAMNVVPKASFGLWIVAIDFLSVGVPFLIVGIAFAIFVSKKEKRKELLMTEGRRVLGKVVEYKVNYQVRYNRMHPVKLICESDEFMADEKKRYLSENFWGDPEAALGKDVTIYVSREANDKYYVDAGRIEA